MSNPSFSRSPPGALANLKDSCKNRARRVLYDAGVLTCLNTHVEYDGMKRLLLDTPLRYLERRRQYLDYDLLSSLDQSTVSRIKGPLSLDSVDVPLAPSLFPYLLRCPHSPFWPVLR
jgi:hypothetical protein